MAKKLIALVLGIMMLMTVAVSGIAEEKSDLHIADDVTLRFFFDLDLAANVPGMQDYNDSDAYKWLEEQTGIPPAAQAVKLSTCSSRPMTCRT